MGIQLDRPREQIDQPDFLGQALGCLGRGIATELQLALLASHFLDQAAIDIVLVGTVALLAEEVAVRIRRCEAGDIEDTDIDCRHCDHGLLACRSRRLDLHLQLGFRQHFLWCVQRDGEFAVAALEGQMGQPQCASRGHLLAAVARTQHRH
ncbi:hypothetical protein SDC9_170006 [bioreactor metagenome]|uniref:Uncharacterized protein n=1 Tax=bioreactor metagenome TaxID=1076179 RepID=A0A645GFU3_9ZZZZ